MLSVLRPVYDRNHHRQPAQQQVLVCVYVYVSLILMGHHLGHSTAEARSRSTPIPEDKIMSTDVREKIIQLQCIARCQRFALSANNVPDEDSNDAGHDDERACAKKCRWDVMKSPRPGFCPSIGNDTVNRLHCLDSCHYDFDCPEVQKCCPSTCGQDGATSVAVCLNAVGLHEDPQLPPIPRILKFTLARSHKVEITIQSSANSTYFCHVEARYHIGVTFSPRKLGRWHYQPVEKIAEISDKRTKRTDITFNLKPGRWYQVRVAAINEFGFKGYSEPSREFHLSIHPKPPKAPQDLRVFASYYDGHNYSVKIMWCPSKSNLPIEKYKIIWSLYVKTKDESFISNYTYIKDKLQFEIAELKPDSSYYIQVQAITISGNRRLKSEKTSLLYNTTVSMAKQNLPFTPLKCSQQPMQQEQHHHLPHTYYHRNDIKHNKSNTIGVESASSPLAPTEYTVRFLSNKKHGLIVRISGLHSKKEKIYELCRNASNCEQREYTVFRAKKDSWEFTKLKFNTTYTLRPFRSNFQASGNGTFTFTTPSCEHFLKEFPKTQIKC